MPQLTKVAVLIEKEGKFLLVQENAAHVRGLWNWPQGTVEESEDLEVAARREVKEETGLDIHIVKKLTVLPNVFPDTKELHVFLGTITGGVVYFPTEEIQAVSYFNLKEIEKVKESLVGEWVYQVIKASGQE